MYTDLDNRGRARVRDKKRRRPILLEQKHENFVVALRKWQVVVAGVVRKAKAS